MKRSTWRILAFGALLGAVSLPASAQVVIGGSNAPSVEVNWSVLDNLGRQPTLADMLKADIPGAETRPVVGEAKSKAKGVQYRPYKAGAKPYAKPAKAAATPKPKKSQVVPAAAKAERMADLVQSSHKAVEAKVAMDEVTPVKAQVKPAAETAKPAAPAIIGPQIALPEVPKPAAPAASAPAAPVAKVEPKPEPKVEAPTVEAKAEPAPAPVSLPPTALTPPPLPAASKAEAPQQVAALPPSPAPVAAPQASSSRGGDTVSIPFGLESARVPDGSHADLDRLVKRMQKDDGLGLQLLAYAEGDEASSSKARRLSLSRALEVRKYLMEQGLRSTRIEVRALGNKLEGGGPADRVDAVLVTR